jgi:hypothetical protein
MANCNWCGDETKPGLYENHKCIEKQKFVVEATLTKHYEIEVEAEDAMKAIESLDDWIADDFEDYEVGAKWDFEAR